MEIPILVKRRLYIETTPGFPWSHAGNTSAGNALWLLLSGSLKPGSEDPLKLSKVNLSCGDIFIMTKAITQQVANWLIAWAFV